MNASAVDAASLPSTSDTLQQVAIASFAFWALDTFLAHGPMHAFMLRVCRRWASPELNTRKVDEIYLHSVARFVGVFHTLVQVPIALCVIFSPGMAHDRLYSHSRLSWRMLTISTGYFLYDLYVHALRYEYWTNLAHAIAAISIFATGTFTGVLHYYGAMFLLWEMSSPFVGLRYFIHGMGRNDTKLYLYNGLTMMVVFFLCRNVLGLVMSADYWRVSGHELAAPRPGGTWPAFLWMVRILNVFFNTLNAIWFSKMLRGAIKVLGPKPKGQHLHTNGATAEAHIKGVSNQRPALRNMQEKEL